MSDILLDYSFQVNVNVPIPSADLSFLRTPVVVVKPKMGATPGYYTVNTVAELEALTDNDSAQYLFGINQGKLASFKVIVSSTLDIQALVDANIDDFFTILISDDFVPDDFFYEGSDSGSIDDELFGSLDVGVNFAGVIGFTVQRDSDDGIDAENREWLKTWSITHTGFYGHPDNFFHAFGSLLGQTQWLNRQYITVPQTGVTTEIGLGFAQNLFNDRISFAITSPQYGNRLAFFAHGGQAIVAPYVVEEIKILMQSEALSWINLNMPNYLLTQAVLLQDELTKVFAPYIARFIIESGTVEITLEDDNFIAKSTITMSEPKALWRVRGELFQV